MLSYTVPGSVIACTWISLVLVLCVVPVAIALQKKTQDTPLLFPILWGIAACLASLLVRTILLGIIFPVMPFYETVSGNEILSALHYALLTVLLEETARLLLMTNFLKPELRTPACSAVIGLSHAWTEGLILMGIGLISNLMAFSVINGGLEDVEEATAKVILSDAAAVTCHASLHYGIAQIFSTVRQTAYAVFMMRMVMDSKYLKGFGIVVGAHFVLDAVISVVGLYLTNLWIMELILLVLTVPAGWYLYRTTSGKNRGTLL